MLKVSLKNDSAKEVNKGTTLFEVAKSLGGDLYKKVCVAKVDGKIADLKSHIEKDCSVEFLTFDSEEGSKAYWHTTAHVLAQAMSRLFPNVKIATGPAIERGFYYDFDIEDSITSETLEKLEAEMKKIINEDLPIEIMEVSEEDALEIMEDRNQPYKIELIKKHAKDGNLIMRKQGEFIDLCGGPHLMSTAQIKAFKLTSSTGAYWMGDSKNKMLKRIYGISFPTESQLKEYLEAVEDAKKRDHNKLGRELEFFTTVDYIGQGLPIMLPKGSKVLQILQRFVEDEEEKRGYLITKTPFLAKSDLYKISGHWYHYKENMFILGDEEKDDEVFALRPMTCPFQFQVFLNRSRSYRDLPMRLNETSTLFRNEASGEMHGLIRLRQFTISEGHIACTPEQLEDEFKGCIDLAHFILKSLHLENDITYRFSKWDENDREKYIGSAEEWESVQNKMKNILDNAGVNYVEADGEAAFYGPKLDIQFKNVYGKEDTLITVQIDFQLAKKFEMEYTDKDGQKKHPYVIHRTSLGCYERTLALLIEKHAGALPLWLAPEQVRILPLSEAFLENSKNIEKELRKSGIPRVFIDSRNEKIGYKIREAQVNKVPYMVVIGNKEAESGEISVRGRSEGDLGSMTIANFSSKLLKEIEEKQ